MFQGSRQDWQSQNGLAAAASETVYFPVGAPERIVTTGRVVGIHQRILLKEVIGLSTDTAARINQIGYYTRAGDQVWLLKHEAAVTSTGGIPVHCYGGHLKFTFDSILEDVECIYVCWTNSDGSNTKYVWTGIRYVPLR